MPKSVVKTPRVLVTYDKIDKSFSLENLDEGTITYAKNIVLGIQMLRQLGFTPSQAREGILKAIFNDGNALDMRNIEKVAKLVDDKPLPPNHLANRVYKLAESVVNAENISDSQVEKIDVLMDQIHEILK